MQWRNQAIKKEMELMDSKFDKEKCQQRIAALGGGIARIKVREGLLASILSLMTAGPLL